ncbi:exopolysaccharide biosynthesis protein [Nitratireductor aquibiodomus]|uniref:exopolysaccharide biosynthesis protein n=1 Tax=Nitratireductor aquibiodomus TaxID=204799 RepID=UPI001FCBCFCB|nr:exopolysaccharide biosynthesis protein [Nitratireductor aquibiodomus]
MSFAAPQDACGFCHEGLTASRQNCTPSRSRFEWLARMSAMKAEGTDLDTVLGAPPAHLPPRRLSRIFRDLAKHAEDKVTIGEIRQALGDRSFATLLVFFASLNLLPSHPAARSSSGRRWCWSRCRW